MGPSGIGEDYCRCGHVASRHTDGEGSCADCRRDSVWGRVTRCVRFAWAETWEDMPRSA